MVLLSNSLTVYLDRQVFSQSALPTRSRCVQPRAAGLHSSSTTITKRRCECYNLYDQCIPYMDAWTWQKALVKKKMEAIQQGQDVDDALIILQHNPVYTLGTRSSEEYLLFDKDQPPCDLYRTERGGEVTYHGPGQASLVLFINCRQVASLLRASGRRV
ncbi:hypothetical protein L7F22_015931 [Adiantum nelumboides]|nr:hypothetical protein [Adiantum nelumboides]